MRFTVSATAGASRPSRSAIDGVVRAYLNRCAHVPVELDWVEGEFFD